MPAFGGFEQLKLMEWTSKPILIVLMKILH